MNRLMLTMLLIGLTSALTASDVYMKTKTTTPAVELMGSTQPAREDVFEYWMTSKGIAVVMPARRIVVNAEQNLFIMIDNEQKTYIEMQLPLDKSKLFPEGMTQMMDMMKATVKVNPTGQTRKIKEWNCSGYKVTMDMGMMQMKQVVWATTDVPFDWKRFVEMNANVLKLQEQFLDEAGVNELLKIKGVHISSETTITMMGTDVTTVMEVQEITEKKAPENLFAIPSGYRKITQLGAEHIN